MNTAIIILCVAAGIALLVLFTAYICFRITFYAPRKNEDHEKIDIPDGDIYQPYKEQMIDWTLRMRSMPHEDVSITSFDGLTLRGKYFEYAPGAPIELMVHGYRGNAERDMCGGIIRSFSIGHSALLVDQRASGYSDGHVISFGVNESRDCRAWIDFMIEHFGPDVKISLAGISMGAATVMIVAGQELPGNVFAVLADCGYTSAKEIICKVMKQIHLPPKVFYPFVRLGARLFGHFDLEEVSPIESMKKCRIPIIFYHGTADNFVPHEMSIACHEACVAPKKLVLTPDAGHGLCYLRDRDVYVRDLMAFYEENNLPAKFDPNVD